MKRVRVALNAPRTVYDFAVFARVVATRLSEDPLFSPPADVLATLLANVAALEAAVPAARTRAFGASPERKAWQCKVLLSLQIAQAYVQSLADARSPDEAAMVVKRAGMDVKDAKGPKRPELTVKPGRTSGTAHAYAPAAKTRAGYEWHLSHDGVTWEPRPFTMRADVELDGLIPGALIGVRARAVTVDGSGDWLGPVTFRVG